MSQQFGTPTSTGGSNLTADDKQKLDDLEVMTPSADISTFTAAFTAALIPITPSA